MSDRQCMHIGGALVASAGTTKIMCSDSSSCTFDSSSVIGEDIAPLGAIYCETQTSFSFGSVENMFANCLECSGCTSSCQNLNFSAPRFSTATQSSGPFQATFLKAEYDSQNQNAVAVFEHDDVTGVRSGDVYGEVQVKFYTSDCVQMITTDIEPITIQAPSDNFFQGSTGLPETQDLTTDLSIAGSVHTAVKIPIDTLANIGTASTNDQGDQESGVCIRLRLVTPVDGVVDEETGVFSTTDVVLTSPVTFDGTVSLGEIGMVGSQPDVISVLVTVLGAFRVAAFRFDLSDPSTALGSDTEINEGDFFSVCFKPQKEQDNGDPAVDTAELSVVSITSFSCQSTSDNLVREPTIIADSAVVTPGATTFLDCTLQTGDPAGIGCGFSTTLDSGFFSSDSDITISCEGVAVLEEGLRRVRRELQVSISGSVLAALSLVLKDEDRSVVDAG